METAHINQRMHSVFNIMRITYGAVPIVAGFDKFTHLLTNWEQYLNPDIAAMLPFSPHTFMIIVGVIEIAAGLLVFAKPAIGGYIVMAWLSLIAFTLLLSREYLDVAVRDLVMATGAYSLVQVAKTVAGSKTHEHTQGEMAYQ